VVIDSKEMARKRYAKRKSTGRKRRVYKKTSRVRRAPATKPRRMVRGTDDYYNNPTLLLGLQRDYKTRPERSIKRTPAPVSVPVNKEPSTFEYLGRFAVDTLYRNINVPRVFGLTDDKTPEFVKSIFPDFYKNQDQTEKQLLAMPNDLLANKFLTFFDGQRRPGDIKDITDFLGKKALDIVGIPDLSDQIPYYKEAKKLYDGTGLKWLKDQKDFLLSDDNEKVTKFRKEFLNIPYDQITNQLFYDYFGSYTKKPIFQHSQQDLTPDFPSLVEKFKTLSRKNHMTNAMDSVQEESMRLIRELPQEFRNFTFPTFIEDGLDYLSDVIDDRYNSKTTIAPDHEDNDLPFTPVKRSSAPWKSHFGDDYIEEGKKTLPYPSELKKDLPKPPVLPSELALGIDDFPPYKERVVVPESWSPRKYDYSYYEPDYVPPRQTEYRNPSLDYNYQADKRWTSNGKRVMSLPSGFYDKSGRHHQNLPTGYYLNNKDQVIYDPRPVVTKDSVSLPRRYFK